MNSATLSMDFPSHTVIPSRVKRFAAAILIDLTNSEDEDIVEAACEAMAMTQLFFDVEDDDENEDDESRH